MTPSMMSQRPPASPQPILGMCTDALIDLALSHAYLGDREKALELAEDIKSFGGDFIEQADLFIKNVNSGFYENNPLK